MTDITTEPQDEQSQHLESNPFSDPTAPLNVRIRLERWDNDFAHEVGSAEFDGRAVFDAESLSSAYFDLDWVFYSAVSAGLVDAHDGPFTVDVPEGLDEYIEHRENAGMVGPYPSAAESLAAARLDHLRTKLEQAVAEVERLRTEVATAEKDGGAER